MTKELQPIAIRAKPGGNLRAWGHERLSSTSLCILGHTGLLHNISKVVSDGLYFGQCNSLVEARKICCSFYLIFSTTAPCMTRFHTEEPLADLSAVISYLWLLQKQIHKKNSVSGSLLNWLIYKKLFLNLFSFLLILSGLLASQCTAANPFKLLAWFSKILFLDNLTKQ